MFNYKDFWTKSLLTAEKSLSKWSTAKLIASLRLTLQRFRNYPNSRYSKYFRYSRIVKFGEIVKFGQPPSVWSGRV